uniref:Uncharacterized protein n=1 Tax=Peronospora matthiolae TaxID=2874970 RepID=A0AAV1TLG5_9STRA
MRCQQMRDSADVTLEDEDARTSECAIAWFGFNTTPDAAIIDQYENDYGQG